MCLCVGMCVLLLLVVKGWSEGHCIKCYPVTSRSQVNVDWEGRLFTTSIKMERQHTKQTLSCQSQQLQWASSYLSKSIYLESICGDTSATMVPDEVKVSAEDSPTGADHSVWWWQYSDSEAEHHLTLLLGNPGVKMPLHHITLTVSALMQRQTVSFKLGILLLTYNPSTRSTKIRSWLRGSKEEVDPHLKPTNPPDKNCGAYSAMLFFLSALQNNVGWYVCQVLQ